MLKQALRSVRLKDIRPGKVWRFLSALLRYYIVQPFVELYTVTAGATISPRQLASAYRAIPGGNVNSHPLFDPRANFFVLATNRPTLTKTATEHYAAECRATIEAANAYCRHEFDLLGSGPRELGSAIPWLTDWKSGYTWPKKYYKRIVYDDPSKTIPYDVKVPWELSRFYHATTLGQAYWLTGDEAYAQEFVQQVTDWIDQNPFCQTVNWTVGMEVAIRISNIIWGLRFFDGSPALSDSFQTAVRITALQHGRFLMRNLEASPVAGNHYLSDAVGLVFLGTQFPDFTEAAAWLKTGREILLSEIPKQIYPDGVDHELSIPYHRLVTELYVTAFRLLEMNGSPIPAEAWQTVQQMMIVIDAWTKPDGSVPVIGDADDGRLQILSEATRKNINDHRYLVAFGAILFRDAMIYKPTTELPYEILWLAGASGITEYQNLPNPEKSRTSHAFPDGGFYIMQHGRDQVVIDAGGVGLRGLGGHGHNDVSSFVLSLDGTEIITDPGSYVYTADYAARNSFRQSAAHNVLVVDSKEINPFDPRWLFSLPESAHPKVTQWSTGLGRDTLTVTHHGYERLPEPVTYQRTFTFIQDPQTLEIKDEISGGGKHQLDWYFHLSEQILEPSVSGFDVIFSTKTGKKYTLLSDSPLAVTPTIEDGLISPSYGRQVAAKVVRFRLLAALPLVIGFSIKPVNVDGHNHQAKS